MFTAVLGLSASNAAKLKLCPLMVIEANPSTEVKLKLPV